MPNAISRLFKAVGLTHRSDGINCAFLEERVLKSGFFFLSFFFKKRLAFQT